MRKLMFALALLAVNAATVWGGVPQTMNYQFVATDNLGDPVADGAHVLVFAIWDDSTGGTQLWSEAQTVIVENGLGNVILGAVNPMSLEVFSTNDPDSARYLSVTLDSEELSPRTPLTSVAYARVAERLCGDVTTDTGIFFMALGTALTSTFESIAIKVDTSKASTGIAVDTGGVILMMGDNTDAGVQRLGLMTTNKVRPTPLKKLKDLVQLVELSKTELGSELATGIGTDETRGLIQSQWTDGSDTTFFSSFVANDSAGSGLRMNKSELINQIASKTTQTREHVLLSRQVGVPGSASNHTLELATDNSGASLQLSADDLTLGSTGVHATTQNGRSTVRCHDFLSGDSATIDQICDADSGISESMSVINSLAHIEETKHAHGHLDYIKKVGDPATDDSVGISEVLSLDSGVTRLMSILDGDKTLEVFQRFGVSPNPPTKSAIAIPNLLDARKSGNESSAQSAHSRLVLDADSGYVHTAGMTKADLISTIAKEASQTREHILLARQVGLPSATTSQLLELETNDIESHARLQQGDAGDTSGMELLVTDDSTKFALYSKTTGARYDNIVLKRGFSNVEMSLGFDGAGSSGRLYASSDASAGARLGINTTTPTMAFQLVGSGCYTGTFGLCSDRRYKDNIKTLSEPLELIDRLRGVSFSWKRDEFPDHGFPEGEQIGLVAQEVEAVVPGVVGTDATGYKSVDYAKLVPLLIEGMKRQQEDIRQMKSRINDLETTNRILMQQRSEQAQR